MVRPPPARDPVTGRFIPKNKRETEEELTDNEEEEESNISYPSLDNNTITSPAMDQAAIQALLEANRQAMREMMAEFRAPQEKADTLKPSEVYLFKPTSRQDEKSARIFIERINDAQKIYRNNAPKLAMLLSRCLDNEIAHTWYSALSTAEKDELLESPTRWINLLKRDFMGTDAQLRSSADREAFRWSQNRSPAEYVDEKVGKLRIAGMTSEEDIVMRVYEGLQYAPELQLSMAPHNRSSLQQFRDLLREIQDNHRRLHEEKAKTKESRYSSRASPYSAASKPDRYQEKTYEKTYEKSKGSNDVRNRKPAPPKRSDDHFNKDPPYPCKKCTARGQKANHWMVDCPLKDERKAFVGQQDDASSDEEVDRTYQRQQRAYVAMQSILNESSEEEASADEDEVVANFGVACRECKEAFPSNNQLHSHLKSFNAHAVEETPSIVDLTAKPKGKEPEGIANCTETCVKAYSNVDSNAQQLFIAVIDSGFGRSAVNRKLLDSVPHTVKAIKQLVIRGIGGRKKVSELAKFAFYLRSNQGVFLKLEIEALIFDDLGTSLLVGTDYIKAWNLVLDIPRHLATFYRFDKVRRPIAVVHLQITREPMANFVVRAGKDCTISANSVGQIALRMNHSGKADLLFTSKLPEIPDGVVSAAQNAVMYSNQDSEPRQIKRGTILGTATSISAGHFAYAAQATEVLNGFLGQESQNRAGSLETLAFAASNAQPAEKPEDTNVAWLEEVYKPCYRYELPEGIVVPDPSTSTHREVHINDKLPLEQQKQLRKLAKRFAVIFNDGPGMARQSEEEWLRIKVAPELERNLKPRPPYRNAPRAKQAIDDTFNENSQLGRMAPAKHSPYSLPVFVVYKYTPDGAVKKARPVVDLRPLNDVAESDAYPLPLQEDILAAMAQSVYISSIDFVSSFYQHFVHPDDQFRTATASHRGLEIFRVAPMGFKNSPAHNQRTFERLLAGLLWKIVNVYVDDVNIFTKGSFAQHLRDLDAVFRRFADAGYTFKATKTYLGFQELVALGKLVSRLGYSTAEEKLAAIANWDLPRNGHDLERFIGFVGWHRQQVPYFAQRSEILQQLKTVIFRGPRKEKGSPPEKPQERKNRGILALGDLWKNAHTEAFQDLKSAFTEAADILRHFDPTKVLYVFLDASKELGFGVAAYQLEGAEAEDLLKPSRSMLRPIIFLSKCLTPAERNYWPTDLELSGLVWAVKHLRIYIEQTKTVVYTDHRANPVILAARSLRTQSPLKMNTRQQGWAVFLSQYWDNMTVIYKEGRDMVVPDALSRLSIKLHGQRQPEEEKQAFLGVVLLGLDDAELARLRQEVKEEFDDIFEQLQTMPLPAPILQQLPDRPYGLFHQENGSDLVRIDAQQAEPRFVVPRSFRKAMLEAAHDDQLHGGYTRLREALAGVWWPKMSKEILEYVHHCTGCGMNKPRRVGFAPPLKPLPTPPRPFYSLTMDFITDLPPEDEHDMILVVVDRFSKRVAFETGKKAQTAEEWAKCLWDNVFCRRGYGLPNTITTDRDARFTAALWKKVFELAGTRLIYTTAYHPSADGQSERVNQELEIALRFYVDAMQANWKEFLPTIEFYFNSNYSSVVTQTPFQVIYGFTPSTQLTLLTPEAPEQLVQEREAARDIAAEGLQIAAEVMTNRAIHDRSFDSGWARLRLSPKSYSLPSTRKFALSPRYTRAFRILEEVGKGNALRMDLPAAWRIHQVISKIHLDPAPSPDDDPYQRNLPPAPDHIDEQGMEQWKVEKIVGKLVNGEAISYKVRWEGYEAEDDTWEDPTALEQAQESVKAYEEALERSRLRGRRQADGSTLYGEPQGRLRR